MKKFVIGIFVLSFNWVWSQENIQIQKLSEPQTFYIASRTNLNGGKSRVCKYVALPENTVKWGFSISTNKAKGGQTVTNNLNLLSQTIGNLDSNITSTKEISVPQGDSFIQTFIVDKKNRDLFLSQNSISDWKIKDPVKSLHYLGEGLLDQVKQGIAFITEETTGSWYLCMRNPDRLYGINANVETIAYVSYNQDTIVNKIDAQSVLSEEVDELTALQNESINYWIKKDHKKAKKVYKEYRSKGGDNQTYKTVLEKAIQTHQIDDKKIKRFLKKL